MDNEDILDDNIHLNKKGKLSRVLIHLLLFSILILINTLFYKNILINYLVVFESDTSLFLTFGKGSLLMGLVYSCIRSFFKCNYYSSLYKKFIYFALFFANLMLLIFFTLQILSLFRAIFF